MKARRTRHGREALARPHYLSEVRMENNFRAPFGRFHPPAALGLRQMRQPRPEIQPRPSGRAGQGDVGVAGAVGG